jgi:hypothetical protein
MVSINKFNTSSNDDSIDEYADMPELIDSDDDYADMPALVEDDDYADMPALVEDDNYNVIIANALQEAFMNQIERLNNANQTGNSEMALSALQCINILLGNNI